MQPRKLLSALCAAALCLTLSTPALAADGPFRDAGEIQYPEAVNAVVALGVMEGKEGGAYFDPTGPVTRGEMAEMLCAVLCGGKLPASPAAIKETPSYSDIRGHWAENYIEYCTDMGIALRAGEESSCDPYGVITFYEAARAALETLGYDQAAYRLEGEAWIVNTDELSRRGGLLDGLRAEDISGEVLTREAAAQLLYNMLDATTKRVKPSASLSGEVTWEFVDGAKLLYERYGFASWDEIPALTNQVEPTAGTQQRFVPAADPTAFSDAGEITHWAAASALVQLGVINGKGDGAFHPVDTLTRAEAAKLISMLFNGGKDLASLIGAGNEPSFSDIKGHWAEDYIAFCVDAKVLSGRGDSRFDPEGQVTGLELMKMTLAMLGYDPSAYELSGPQWAENTDALARRTNPSLYQGLTAIALSEPVSRDNAVQILCNALENTTRTVTPKGDGAADWHFLVSEDTFLHQHFGLEELPVVPTQPGK